MEIKNTAFLAIAIFYAVRHAIDPLSQVNSKNHVVFNLDPKVSDDNYILRLIRGQVKSLAVQAITVGKIVKLIEPQTTFLSGEDINTNIKAAVGHDTKFSVDLEKAASKRLILTDHKQNKDDNIHITITVMMGVMVAIVDSRSRRLRGMSYEADGRINRPTDYIIGMENITTFLECFDGYVIEINPKLIIKAEQFSRVHILLALMQSSTSIPKMFTGSNHLVLTNSYDFDRTSYMDIPHNLIEKQDHIEVQIPLEHWEYRLLMNSPDRKTMVHVYKDVSIV